MTPDIKRILYATDLSENSVYAFGYAVDLANQYDAEITLLHVIDKTMQNSQMWLDAYIDFEQVEGSLQKRIADTTEEIKNRLKVFLDKKVANNSESADKVVAIEICHGFPADEILQKADDFHCDVIVMGTHGKGIVSRAFFGSVAKRVLRRVRKPVFIIPLPEE